MAATKYTYSISVDFPNHIVSPGRFLQEIEASAIVTAADCINTNDDDCDVWFVDVLSPGDEAILDGLVAVHSGDPLRAWELIAYGSAAEPVVPGASLVVANDRPAIEVEDGITGFAAVRGDTLAIAFRSIGFVGKLFGEALEEAQPGPVEALTAAGAPWAG